MYNGWMDLPLKLRTRGGPLYARIREEIRDLVARGILAPGARLPSVRSLGAQLRVSFLTVLRAYRELAAMGYLDMEEGIGTRVNAALPEPFLAPPPGSAPLPRRRPRGIPGPMNARARALDLAGYIARQEGPFRLSFNVGEGDLRLFPFPLWRRLHQRTLATAREAEWGRGVPPQGVAELRAAICETVLPARGIRAAPDEVLVTAGSLQGIHGFLDLVLERGDRVAVEDPCYALYPRIAGFRGGRTVFVPVDGQGIDPARFAGVLARHRPRAAILTSSHQYPTTATLDLARRHALARLAAPHRLWILEDDYDSDFHYDSPPLPALKSLDATGRVTYFGTFTKTLFPALRLGFMVAAPGVVRRMAHWIYLQGFHVPVTSQRVAAEFLRRGHYDHHVRRMRRTYHARRDAMAEALRRHLPGFAFVVPSGGMRFWVRVPDGIGRDALREGIRKAGCYVRMGSADASARPGPEHLHLGFACLTEREIDDGIRTIARVVRRLRIAEPKRRGVSSPARLRP